LGKYIQIVFSGKAHPQDYSGKELIKDVFRYMRELEGAVSTWFIEDYDMQTAKYVIRGVDLLLNTPMRLLEASQTSGMKAAVNLVPHLSIPDGWWIPREPAKGYTLPNGAIEGVTGWVIGRMPNEDDFRIFLNGNEYEIQSRRQQDRKNDAESLCDKLEHEIIPLFRDHRTTCGTDNRSYAKVMKGAAAHNAPWFNTHRMARQYFEEVYNPLLEKLGVKV
ncbi:glycogen/starch/alpha-glucan phosphorylase, partial [archaeon]|nr:glycogen/starch/alpha-glucan phosphorylase [archaeon]